MEAHLPGRSRLCPKVRGSRRTDHHITARGLGSFSWRCRLIASFRTGLAMVAAGNGTLGQQACSFDSMPQGAIRANTPTAKPHSQQPHCNDALPLVARSVALCIHVRPGCNRTIPRQSRTALRSLADSRLLLVTHQIAGAVLPRRRGDISRAAQSRRTRRTSMASFCRETMTWRNPPRINTLG